MSDYGVVASLLVALFIGSHWFARWRARAMGSAQSSAPPERPHTQPPDVPDDPLRRLAAAGRAAAPSVEAERRLAARGYQARMFASGAAAGLLPLIPVALTPGCGPVLTWLGLPAAIAFMTSLCAFVIRVWRGRDQSEIDQGAWSVRLGFGVVGMSIFLVAGPLAGVGVCAP